MAAPGGGGSTSSGHAARRLASSGAAEAEARWGKSGGRAAELRREASSAGELRAPAAAGSGATSAAVG